MKKIYFPPMPEVFYLQDGGFLSQWCCKCQNRHIWHVRVHRGKNKDEDFVEIRGFQDEKANELREYYMKSSKKGA